MTGALCARPNFPKWYVAYAFSSAVTAASLSSQDVPYAVGTRTFRMHWGAGPELLPWLPVNATQQLWRSTQRREGYVKYHDRSRNMLLRQSTSSCSISFRSL